MKWEKIKKMFQSYISIQMLNTKGIGIKYMTLKPVGEVLPMMFTVALVASKTFNEQIKYS